MSLTGLNMQSKKMFKIFYYCTLSSHATLKIAGKYTLSTNIWLFCTLDMASVLTPYF